MFGAYKYQTLSLDTNALSNIIGTGQYQGQIMVDYGHE